MHWELRAHPAQARHPITKAPLFNDDGTHVPLLPDHRALYLDGYCIAYCTMTTGLRFCRHVPVAVAEAAQEFVKSEIGQCADFSIPPAPEPDLAFAEEDE